MRKSSTTKKRKKEEDEPVVCITDDTTKAIKAAETLFDHDYLSLQSIFDITKLNKKQRDDFVVSVMLSEKYTETQKKECFDAVQIYTGETQKRRKEMQKKFYSIFDMEIPMDNNFKGSRGLERYIGCLPPEAKERFNMWYVKEKTDESICSLRCMTCNKIFAHISPKKAAFCYACLRIYVFNYMMTFEIKDFQQIIEDILKTMTDTIIENKAEGYKEQVTEIKNRCVDVLLEEKYSLAHIATLLKLTTEERTALNIRLLSLHKYSNSEKEKFVRSLLKRTEGEENEIMKKQATINSVFRLEIVWSFEYMAKTTSYYLSKLSEEALSRFKSWHLEETIEEKLVALKCYVCEVSYVCVSKDSAYGERYDDPQPYCCHLCLSNIMINEDIILKIIKRQEILQKMIKVIQDKVITSEPLIKNIK